MAIDRGAGTEIIRSIHLEAVAGTTEKPLIYGVQHHIYTVLSISAYKVGGTAGNWLTCFLTGYDANAGETAQINYIFRQDMSNEETFVWNDKFSFNGHEPVDFTGPVDSVVKQDAIADQGSSVAQILYIDSQDAGDTFDVTCTYIDQNNA